MSRHVNVEMQERADLSLEPHLWGVWRGWGNDETAQHIDGIAPWDGERERPGFDRWRFAWTRAKHLRRAALWYRIRGQVLHSSTTPENLCHNCRAALASVLWEKAADRADWGTRP